jgi:hypothetical protein
MRVFCHVHKRTFQAGPLAEIVCEQGHLLGAAADNNAGIDLWEYCCGCQTFWLVSPEGPGATECPNCRDQITTRFFCNQCRTLVLETERAVNGREFFIALSGVPLPSCPGCARAANANVAQHECRLYKGRFFTARTGCAFCGEAIVFPLAFPISVAGYLRDFEEARTEVQFDAATNQFVTLAGGSFFVAAAGPTYSEVERLFPSASVLDSPDKFFTTYSDHFLCDEPATGRVIVEYPATVRKTGKAWVLNSRGRLRMTSAETDSGSHLANQSGASCVSESSACITCGAPGKPSHRFCKQCGAPRATGLNRAIA